MEGASFNEEEPVQQHSLPEPERRKPYNESAVGRKRLLIRLAIWTTAGILIAIVIVAFSLAIINNTYPEDTTRGSSPAVNEPDMPSEDEGGLDFDLAAVLEAKISVRMMTSRTAVPMMVDRTMLTIFRPKIQRILQHTR